MTLLSPFFIKALKVAVFGDLFWEPYLGGIMEDSTPFGLHLAILIDPYLQYVLQGKKTIESRFSMRRFAPFNCVERNDVVLLKRSGGPIVGLCQVTDAWYYQLDPRSWTEIRNEFTQMLCAQDPSFWTDREKATFATLMRLGNVRKITPIKIPKNDRRGWVVLKPNTKQCKLSSI